MENKKLPIELPIVFSDRFKDTLKNITHYISDYLLEKEEILNSTYSFIDIGNSSDTISFIQSNKAKDIIDNNENWQELIWTSKRCNMKIGKFLSCLVGNVFSNNKLRNTSELKSNDIESFVNKYKIEFNFDEYKSNFQIVEDSKILYWYLEDNYADCATTSTSLGNSCMRYSKYQKFLELYKDNSDKIKLLIYKDENNKLLGRAILWYLDQPEERIFMDRIYSTEDKIIDIFKKYASINKWYYKSYQTYGCDHQLVDTSLIPHELVSPKLKVCLKQNYYRYIPYIDTLSVLEKKTNILTNDITKVEDAKNYLYCVGDSGLSIIDREAMDNGKEYDEDNDIEDEDLVYSGYHGQDIQRSRARYCEIGEDWVYNDQAIFIFNSGHKYAVPGDDNIMHSEYSNKWFLKHKTIYSDYHNSYIFIESAIRVYKDLDRNSCYIMHKNEYSKYIEHDNYYYISELKKDIQEKYYVVDNIETSNVVEENNLTRFYDIETDGDLNNFRILSTMRTNNRLNRYYNTFTNENQNIVDLFDRYNETLRNNNLDENIINMFNVNEITESNNDLGDNTDEII